jgi:drug/metabolite transporter (DMT)-like permease
MPNRLTALPEPVIGAAFALATATLWGVLPIALKLLVAHIDPLTLTAVRFATATILLGTLMRAWRMPTAVWGVVRARPVLHLVALLGLFGNFVLFAAALRYISPTSAQLLAQWGPLLLIAGGTLILREPLSPMQAGGAVAVMIGMALFFHEGWEGQLHGAGSGLGMGYLIMMAGATSWAAYAMAQRRIAVLQPPRQSLLLLYAASAVLLLPFSHPASLLTLRGPAWIALAFAAVGTVLSYGSLAEALRRLDAARVGAIVSIAPLLTALSNRLLASWAPTDLKQENLDAMAIVGGLIVVIGSTACAIGARSPSSGKPTVPLPRPGVAE